MALFGVFLERVKPMEKEKSTFKFGTIAGYGLGGMFPLGFVLCLANYLNLFLTDYAKFPVALAATIYTAIQIIKMITMAISGVIVDKFDIKAGKYRTWILISGIALGISFPLCFYVFKVPTGTYVVLILVFYFIQSLAYNVSWTAQHAVIAPMSKNNSDVVLLNTVSQFAGLFTSVIYMVSGAVFAQWKDQENYYFVQALVFGVIIILGSILLYAMCGKYEKGSSAQTAQKQKGMSFGEMLKAFKGPAIPFFFSYTFTAATTGFIQALLGHFATYVLGNTDVVALSGGATAICGVLGCVLTPMMTKKLTKKNIHIVSQIVSCIAYILLVILGKNATLFIVMRGLATFVGMPSTIVMTAIANDLGDQMEMEGKEAPRAFLQSLAGTANRAGLVISAAIGTSILGVIGYEVGVVFTDAMKSALTFWIAALPAGCCAIAAIIMIFCKTDEKAIAAWKANKQ